MKEREADYYDIEIWRTTKQKGLKITENWLKTQKACFTFTDPNALKAKAKTQEKATMKAFVALILEYLQFSLDTFITIFSKVALEYGPSQMTETC